MSRWFRFYDEALDDPKVQRLAPHLFKAWINIMCLASKGEGKLPSNDDIAFKLRISVHDAAQQIEDLILAGLVDICPDGTREPHNWKQRQYASDSSAERMRKHRENKKKKAGDVTGDDEVTVQKQTQKQNRTDSETEQSACARQSEVSKFVSGSGGRSLSERLLRRAESFGLPVEAFKARSLAKDVGKPNGFFRKLCVDELAKRLPRAPRATLEAAFEAGNDAAYGQVQSWMVGA